MNEKNSTGAEKQQTAMEIGETEKMMDGQAVTAEKKLSLFSRFWAALIFFTRLPWWKLKEVESECFKHVVPFWPLVGWLTGGVMAGVLWLGGQVLPVSVAWLLAIVARMWLTGALHEDGLADFMDGFGGGMTRDRVLVIMKDSHIGTYGVLTLLVYVALLWQLHAVRLETLCLWVLCGDAFAKFCTSQLVNVLPYARKEEESKAKIVYHRMSKVEKAVSLVGGVLPVVCLLPLEFGMAVLAPVLVAAGLYLYIKKRIQGYTGDCCGAVFLLSELAFYLGCMVIYYQG